jgi:nicotinate-nucleotide adenylyltransferase
VNAFATDRLTGIFGGTFDPPHIGHINVARQMIDGGHVRQVILIPAASPPHKCDSTISAANRRLEMTRLAVEEHPDLFVSDLELQRDGPSYTIDTAKHFAEIFGAQLRIIIGMDSLRDLHTWYQSEDLISNYRFLIYGRPGVEPLGEAELAANYGDANGRRLACGLVGGPPVNLSATQLRKELAAGKDCSAALPSAVAHYIAATNLYREN